MCRCRGCESYRDGVRCRGCYVIEGKLGVEARLD